MQRIIAALQDERLAMSLCNGGIRLGPKVSSLAAAAHLDVTRMCRPIMENIGRRSGKTADLSVLRSGKMLFVDQVVGVHRLHAVSHVGDEFPLSPTANGKAVLALMPDAKVERAMERDSRVTRARWFLALGGSSAAPSL